MNNNEDGGAAFPAAAFDPRDSSMCWQDGMTLRDYFAAKAMPEVYGRVESGGFEYVAKLSYEMADAMLKARQQ